MVLECFFFEDNSEYMTPVNVQDVEEMRREQGYSDYKIPLGTWSHSFDEGRNAGFAYGAVEAFTQSDIGACLIDHHGKVITYSTFTRNTSND